MPSRPNGPELAVRRVAVLGLGLMGGSLARALRALDGPEVTGWTPDVEEGKAAGLAALSRAVTTLEDALEGADLVVLATPLGPATGLLAEVARHADAEAVVTDVVSLKVPMGDAARDAGLGARFVGSHPMAGGEGSGFGASSADLYRGAPVWVVAGEAAPGAVERVEALWTSLGASPTRIDAAEHDRLMALASHLPQLTANALATVLDASGVPASALGPGGRDTTRLAGSSPEMWIDLLAAAPPELADGLRALAGTVAEIADRVDGGDADGLRSLMEATRSWRVGP